MDNVKIGSNIQWHRKNKKMTQKELGAAIGKTESTIAKYERGLVEIPLSILENIAGVFSIPLNKLIGGKPFIMPEKVRKALAFDDYARSLGYYINGDPSEGYLWIEHDGNTYEIYDTDLEDVMNSSAAFVRFRLHEIMNRDKKDGDQ